MLLSIDVGTMFIVLMPRFRQPINDARFTVLHMEAGRLICQLKAYLVGHLQRDIPRDTRHFAPEKKNYHDDQSSRGVQMLQTGHAGRC